MGHAIEITVRVLCHAQYTHFFFEFLQLPFRQLSVLCFERAPKLLAPLLN
jgi:hypothetical protein